jgi:capsular polysaccharide transport system ATP-binding protein
MKLDFLNVSKVHDRKKQVYDVLEGNVSFPQNKNTAILSKHGRSSVALLNLISGIDQPTRGLIKREGLFTGVIGDPGYFHRDLSGEQNIRFICKIYGQDPNKVIEDVKKITGLGKELKQKTKSYPLPLKRKIALSTSLMMKSDVYQLKGVLNHPQAKFNNDIQTRLQEIAEEATLILATEDTKTLNKYADAAVVIDTEGRLETFSDLASGIEAHKALKMDA